MQRSYLMLLLLAGYLLLLTGIWLPEANWQLGGMQFSTRLSHQWSGYIMLFFVCITAFIQAGKVWRRRLPSFWAAFLVGGYTAGFAMVKWARISELSSDFQQVSTGSTPAVSTGAGLWFLGLGGVLLLVAAVAVLRKGYPEKSPTIK